MSVPADPTARSVLHWVHPLHAVLLAGTIPLFLGAMLSDLAYMATYEIQWSNFASWLIAGGLAFTGLTAVWAVADLLRADCRHWRAIAYALLLVTTWILGFINALIHAMDAWATMPAGLLLSAMVVALACAATAVGFASLRVGNRRVEGAT